MTLTLALQHGQATLTLTLQVLAAMPTSLQEDEAALLQLQGDTGRSP